MAFHRFINKLGNWFLALPRVYKRVLSLGIDTLAISFTLWAAFCLRLGEWYIPPIQQMWIFVLAPIIAIPIFIRAGLYRAIIRYIGMEAIWTIVQSIMLFSLVFAVIVLVAEDLSGLVPRTVYGIHAVLLLLFVAGSRYLGKWLFNRSQADHGYRPKRKRFLPPVVIYGAGKSGAQIASMLKLSQQLNPVAFIDDEPSLHRQLIHGVTVHSFAELPKLIERYGVQDVLLAMPSVSRFRRKQILESLTPYSVHVKTLPNLMNIAEGQLEVSDIREVDIGDVLGRDPVPPNQALLDRNIREKVVMVTGAGGSIGAELCRQILQHQPKQLLLFELSEFNLYELEHSLNSKQTDIEIIPLLGSVTDQSRVEGICRHFSVDTIYHAAAYKHVPLVERNTREGIWNNVFGTLHCAQAAVNAEVETFVLISTDKAVRPTNTMGASKRLAELVLQAMASDATLSHQTRFTMVRFGNVLGSSGSVVPLFRQQIASGGPVTVTHPDIIRYFMTIPEAAELVIQAGAMGQGGDVFVLDMGEPVKIKYLAENMIRLSGFSVRNNNDPEGDIAIEYTGLRPGEKLYEELLIGDNVTPTEHSKIMRAQENEMAWESLSVILKDIQCALDENQTEQLRAILLSTIEEFTPQCDVVDWLA
jgi:FlaA1/EpsC-like NDP-sugar epimerase